jgi:hypothetical protein
MKMSQGNSLYSYLKQTIIYFFVCHKIGKQEGRTDAGPIILTIGTSGKRGGCGDRV